MTSRWCSIFAASFLACIVSVRAEARLEALKGFDKDLAAHGVTERYSASGMEALLALVREQIEEADREGERAIADAGRGVLYRATKVSASSDPAVLSEEFDALKSFLYSLRSEVRGEVKTCLLADILRLINNASLEVPYLTPQERARPLTPGEAALEATNLVDARSGTEYAEPTKLAGLSPEQISELDVRRDDYLWHDEAALAALKARHGTAWKALEAEAEARVSETDHVPYSLPRARRILLFRGIKSTATTPKIDAEDLNGHAWKVKWGEEVQAEPVANHLYAELGGKFADLVYVNKGPSDLVLVLDESGSPTETKRCESVATFDDFKHCLRKSKYKFDVSAYVVGHGVVSEAMLRDEPFASASGPTSALVGREFVTFNESLVEFQWSGHGTQQLGAGPLSSTGARSQRALRGLAILTYWIHNKDAKDANSKGVVEVTDASYLQYFHDMGASLGSLRISGNPNRLQVGEHFARRRHHDVKFHSNMLYVPKAFHDATYADAMWMIRKIVRLTREDLRAAVARTRWPDFQQDVLASRLIARRNAIARAFDVDSIMPVDTAPTVVSLRTPADRRAAVERYELSIATGGDAEKAQALLEEFMTAAGIDMNDGLTEVEDRPDALADDSVLETTDCKRSVLVAWLETTIHPAGLSRRVYRRADDKPLKACRPTRVR
jgi:hypothetical protein